MTPFHFLKYFSCVLPILLISFFSLWFSFSPISPSTSCFLITSSQQCLVILPSHRCFFSVPSSLFLLIPMEPLGHFHPCALWDKTHLDLSGIGSRREFYLGQGTWGTVSVSCVQLSCDLASCQNQESVSVQEKWISVTRTGVMCEASCVGEVTGNEPCRSWTDQVCFIAEGHHADCNRQSHHFCLLLHSIYATYRCQTNLPLCCFTLASLKPHAEETLVTALFTPLFLSTLPATRWEPWLPSALPSPSFLPSFTHTLCICLFDLSSQCPSHFLKDPAQRFLEDVLHLSNCACNL